RRCRYRVGDAGHRRGPRSFRALTRPALREPARPDGDPGGRAALRPAPEPGRGRPRRGGAARRARRGHRAHGQGGGGGRRAARPGARRGADAAGAGEGARARRGDRTGAAMLRATVKGSVWATRRLDALPNGALLEVQTDDGASLIAFDVLGSGVGERVL